METALRIARLTPFFGNRITTFEHVARGKPEPDVFIEAARRAGYAPADCIVIEDSVTGVTAAHRAGCRVLGFTGTHPHPHEQAPKLLAAGAGTHLLPHGGIASARGSNSSRRLTNTLTLHCSTSIWAMSLLADAKEYVRRS